VAKRQTLLDEIISSLPAGQRSESWFSRLPADVQSEVREIRQQLHAGAIVISKRVLARGIVAALTAKGYRMPGYKQVAEWLRLAN
jgi:hypothetical protein